MANKNKLEKEEIEVIEILRGAASFMETVKVSGFNRGWNLGRILLVLGGLEE